ncbi:hypothetical protein HDU92_000945 [Lobulomyces angularis]|nr:hypothetical protein HDU92_000945 [Lobulomyces angularis]
MKFTSVVLLLSTLISYLLAADGVCQPTGCHGVYTDCRKVARLRGNDCNSTSNDHPYYPCYAALGPSMCQMQADGECAWTVNSTFADCLAKFIASKKINSSDVHFINTTEETSSSVAPIATETSPPVSEGTTASQISSAFMQKSTGFLMIGVLSIILMSL